jgi:hypothetical protein
MDLYSEMVNISKIRDGLFIGDIISGTTLDIVFEFKISHMINTASGQVPSQFQSIGIKYLNLNWPENPSINLPIIKDDVVAKIVNFIDYCEKNGDGLLIYSVKGINRCCVIIFIYLMKKYYWSLEKCKEYLLSKKQDMKITKNFYEKLLNFQIHLHELNPSRKKSVNWIDANIKDRDELIMRNTYINDVELKKKAIIFDNKTKNKNKHVGWVDQINNNNTNSDKKLIHIDIENDLYFKKNVKDITSHLEKRELKSIIVGKNIQKIDSNKNNEQIKTEEEKEENLEFFDNQAIFIKNNNISQNKTENDISKSITKNDMIKSEGIIEMKKYKDNNILNLNEINNEGLLKEVKISEDNSKSNNNFNNNNQMNVNILKNISQKESINNNNNEKLQLNLKMSEINKIGQNGMNINFNNINMPDISKKYYNNYVGNKDNKIINSVYFKNANKNNKKARSTSKNNNNNNVIPYIQYNQNNNIIANIMINSNPSLINGNQKLFVKFNKDNNNNILNNNSNNQFIQNNNFININYYPQSDESKFIKFNFIYYIYRYNSRNK